MDTTPVFARNDVIFLHDGTLLQTHSPARCVGDHCAVHNPSDHPLRDAPLHWSDRFKSMYRSCTHGYVHHDPDDFTFKWRAGLPLVVLALVTRHDCDGCCRWPVSDEDDSL